MLAAFSLITCNSQKTASSDQTHQENGNTETKDNIIYFKQGENKFLEDSKMNFTFLSVTEDSRCPEGVNCVWAGAAVVEVEAMGIATRPMKFLLATITMPSRNLSKTAIFDGYIIQLEQVIPYPKKSKNNSKEYTIGISIHKIAENQTEN